MSQPEEQFRVTSVYDKSYRYVTFKGVPLHAGGPERKSGRYIVSVTAHPEHLPVPPAIGQHWRIVGGTFNVIEQTHNGYVLDEHRYKDCDSLTCSLPENGEQFIKFIADNPDFTGIGEAKARQLWDRFGSAIHAHLQQGSEQHIAALRELLSPASCAALFRGYEKYKNLAHCNWLSQHKVPIDVQRRLLKHHDDQAIVQLKENPYLLISFGLSFAKTDQIAMAHWSIPVNDHRRLAAALQSALIKEVDKGHTYARAEDLKPTLKKLLRESDLVTTALVAGHAQAQYLLGPEGYVHPTAQYVMENVISKRLTSLAAKLCQLDWTVKHEIEKALSDASRVMKGKQLEENQKEAVRCSVENAVSCIVGGAGTGKTTVLRTVLAVYKALGFEIYPVALSGRASMRLSESTSFETCTIAKLLSGPPISSEKALVVIDEASMVDVPTLYRIVTHMNPDARLLMVGDPNQLPPIGCGRVLADVVSAGTMHATTLDIVQRQSDETGIPHYSQSVNMGHPPERLSQGAIYFHETGRDQIPEACAHLYCQYPQSSRVLASTKKVVAAINQKIQNAVNPNGRRMSFEIHGDALFRDDLREGDNVLFTENHYSAGVQNGSLGILSSVETAQATYGKVVLDTGEEVILNQALMDCMEPGYAITLHKAQGSQFPRVIIGLDVSRNRSRSLIDRAWIYTAITRAETEVHLVGREEDFSAIVRAPSKSVERRSYLPQLLNAA